MTDPTNPHALRAQVRDALGEGLFGDTDRLVTVGEALLGDTDRLVTVMAALAGHLDRIASALEDIAATVDARRRERF